MAAPSGIVWGTAINDYGRIGIYRTVTNNTDNTTATLHVEVWIGTKYSVADTNNALYFDNLSSSDGSATTNRGSKTIKTTVDTGGGWSGSNEKKLYTYDVPYNRGTSNATRYLYAKLANVDRVGGTMYVSTTAAIPKLASYAITYNANGGTGAPGSQTKYYGKSLTLSSTRPTRTGHSFLGWSTSSTATSPNTNYDPGDSYTSNANLTLYAVWRANTYTVTYNANGGTGAPGSQTKTYGKTLTLSSTKPTRTGHTFQKWNTKADGSGTNYNSGASYTTNSKVTLYAVWKANTYTVTYSANGGSGAPGAQTKTYGRTLTLSSTKPTRTDYNFLGWSASKTATTATYSAGGAYTANNAITLYAVWELAYTKPSVTNLTVERYSYNPDTDAYTQSDSGTYARVKFNWSTFYDITGITIAWSGNTKSIDGVSGKAGNVDVYIGDGDLSSDSTYTLTITVKDSKGSTIVREPLNSIKYVMDLLKGGNGIAFGKSAETSGVADFAFKIEPREGFTYPVLPAGTDLNTVLTPNIYSGENESTYDYGNCPITSGTFTLEVFPAGPSGQVVQRLTLCDKTKSGVYERTYYGSSWQDDWYGGWYNAEITGPFAVHSGNDNNHPRYRRVGGLVEVQGILSPTSAIAGSLDNTTIFTLPTGYRPTMPIHLLCQGSQTCSWLLTISTAGVVSFGRYRNGDTLVEASTSVWLPFHCTFFVS